MGIIDRPQATLTAIYTSPRWQWVLPLILLLVSLVVLNLVSAPYTAELSREQIRRQMESMPEREQAALVAGQIEQFSSPLFVGLTASVTGVIGLVVAILLAAAVLYFGGLVVGGRARICADDDPGDLGLVAILHTQLSWNRSGIYLQGGLIINQGCPGWCPWEIR